MISQKLQKIIVVAGPTATGKSDIGIELAKQFDGEIISADSRQIYKDMEIGTGAVNENQMDGIPHHLIALRSPKNPFTADDFAKKAERLITDIAKRGKLPIIVGGTGFYIDALLYENALPNVPPNKALRNKLEQCSAEKLFTLLQQKDPDRAADIDPHNKRRLIRALEIAELLGAVPRLKTQRPSKYSVLQIGITFPDVELKERIHARVQKRLESGWIAEVQNLREKGVSWNRLAEIGLGYRSIASHIQPYGREKQYDVKKLTEEITTTEYQYAKRQKRWFKRSKNIEWFQPKEMESIKDKVKNFLKIE